MLRMICAPRYIRVLPILVVMIAGAAHGQTTTFTYQGQLSDAGTLANNSYDLRFALFDTAAGGAQIGANQTVPAVPVSNGVFTVQLDFGVNAFPGANRFVEIGVRPAGGGSFTTLAPRQQISSSPYAIRTLSAATADALSSACVGCVKDTQIEAVAGSKVSGSIPAASLPTGSGNYIQNTTAPQATSSFNISGNGTVGGTLSASSLGVGTSTPTQKLEVSGNVKLSGAGNGVVFPDGSKQTTAGGSGGVSGSGTTNTLPLWTAGTTLGNSLITQSGLSVQLPNNVSLGVGAQGNAVAFGSPNGETGMTISGTTGRSDLRFDGTTLKLIAGPAGGPPAATNGVAITTAGSVGIGIENPTIGKLNVVGNPGVPAIYGESANRAVWGHCTGASRGVYGDSVSGEGVHGESTSGTGVAGVTASANITSPGVGGASTANGGVGVRGDGTTGVYGKSTSNGGVGVSGESNNGSNAVGVFGTSTSVLGQGVRGESTAATGYGVYAKNLSGIALAVEGNTTQNRDRGGLVKAMVAVDSDGTISRCFNSLLAGSAATTAPCGFDSPVNVGGFYHIDFGFKVNDRFISITSSTSGSAPTTANFYFPDANRLYVQIYTLDDGEALAPFMVIVF